MIVNSRILWPRSINMSHGDVLDTIPSPDDLRVRAVLTRADGSVEFDEVWIGEVSKAADGITEVKYHVESTVVVVN